MIRDEELKRIEKYCAGLGIKVVYKPWKRKLPHAEWLIDGSQITIYTTKSDSKTDTILALVHELGHHMDWVHRNRVTPIKLDIALDKEKPTKKQRKTIYEDEKNGAAYQLAVYKELGLKIPLWKLEMERDHSLWIYYQEYLRGKTPTRAEQRQKRKELILKYKTT